MTQISLNVALFPYTTSKYKASIKCSRGFTYQIHAKKLCFKKNAQNETKNKSKKNKTEIYVKLCSKAFFFF